MTRRQGPEKQIQVVGVTGLEPVTLRLSSACSNQLSYTPIAFFNIRQANLNKEQAGGAEEIRTPDLLITSELLYR